MEELVHRPQTSRNTAITFFSLKLSPPISWSSLRAIPAACGVCLMPGGAILYMNQGTTAKAARPGTKDAYNHWDQLMETPKVLCARSAAIGLLAWPVRYIAQASMSPW